MVVVWATNKAPHAKLEQVEGVLTYCCMPLKQNYFSYHSVDESLTMWAPPLQWPNKVKGPVCPNLIHSQP